MTELGLETRYIPKVQMINDAMSRSARPVVGVIVSKTLQDEIRATRGWISRPTFVDPSFQRDHFEIIISEHVWETRTANLKRADLEPYSARDIAFIRIGIAVFIIAAVVLCALGYFVLARLA
jgi:hypothetical protein